MVTCKADEIGISKDGYKLTVATDSAGSQIIARKGREHFLSEDFGSHGVAMQNAGRIKEMGIESYNGWIDLNKNQFHALFMMACNSELNRQRATQ